MDEKQPLLVPNAKKVMLRAWTIWAALAGLILPVLPDLAALVVSNLDRFTLGDGAKNIIRVACLALVIVLRPLNQRSLPEETSTAERTDP